MFGTSINQATKKQSVCKLYTQAKVENNERKERENTQNLFIQLGPKLT